MPRRSNDGTALVQTTLVVAAGLLVLVLVVIAVAMQFGGS
jgi:preprotein translocase subunit Sec61beta